MTPFTSTNDDKDPDNIDTAKTSNRKPAHARKTTSAELISVAILGMFVSLGWAVIILALAWGIFDITNGPTFGNILLTVASAFIVANHLTRRGRA